MTQPARLALSVAAFFGAWLLMFFVSLMLLPESLAWLQPVVALAFAVWAARRVWWQLEDVAATGLPVFMGGGALIVGGLGFVLGFFGPMIFLPEANQGPLLGIFITGPGGAILGAVIGWWVWFRQR